MNNHFSNIYQWFRASFPLHLLIFLCWMFGSSLISIDINVLGYLYILGILLSFVFLYTEKIYKKANLVFDYFILCIF